MQTPPNELEPLTVENIGNLNSDQLITAIRSYAPFTFFNPNTLVWLKQENISGSTFLKLREQDLPSSLKLGEKIELRSIIEKLAMQQKSEKMKVIQPLANPQIYYEDAKKQFHLGN